MMRDLMICVVHQLRKTCYVKLQVRTGGRKLLLFYRADNLFFKLIDIHCSCGAV